MHWLAGGFRGLAFARSAKKNHGRNNIPLRVETAGNREDVRWSLVNTKSEPFRLRFVYFLCNISRTQYKIRKIWGQIVVIFGLCHHFYFLTLENKVIKQCSLSIYRVLVRWDASVLSLYLSSSRQKKLPKSHF